MRAPQTDVLLPPGPGHCPGKPAPLPSKSSDLPVAAARPCLTALCVPPLPRQSSISSSSSSSATAAPATFQSTGTYGHFSRTSVPAYNQFSTSPLVSPQFGPVGVGK